MKFFKIILISKGDISWLGDYSECLKSDSKSENNSWIPQYCVIGKPDENTIRQGVAYTVSLI